LKWDGHRTQLSAFFKTEAKPAIYYRPAKVDNEIKKENKPSDLPELEETNKEEK
jgi:hypothetical protein